MRVTVGAPVVPDPTLGSKRHAADDPQRLDITNVMTIVPVERAAIRSRVPPPR
jgi:hypothetical protein